MVSESIKKMYTDAFIGNSAYIPLCIQMVNPKSTMFERYEMTMEPEKALEWGLRHIECSKEIKSDWIPYITNYYQDILVPTAFGAKLFHTNGGIPGVIPMFDDLSKVKSFINSGLTLETPLLEQAIKHYEFLYKNKPTDVELLAPTVMSPIDYAINLRGGDFYVDMLLEPELSKEFLNLLCDLIIEQVKTFKAISNEKNDEYITLRGQFFPGLRMACDSIVNLSKGMIEEFVLPLFDRLGKEFGRLMIHYCTTPADSSHVLPIISKSEVVSAIDNWQGYKTFFGKNGNLILQDKISICTDIEVTHLEQELTQPFFTDVARKGGRGLTVTTSVNNLDDGKMLYEKWQKIFLK